MPDSSDNPNHSMGIGALAEATDIPRSTLRTWERRYGFPNPERDDAGHRRYTPETVERLRSIRRLLDNGYRASDVVGASDERLETLLEQLDPDRAQKQRDTTEDDALDEPWLAKWLDSVRRSAAAELDQVFREEWTRVGALEFLIERAAPFLRAVGDQWASGKIDVRHEHGASEVLRDFLGHKRRRMSGGAGAPTAVCATVSGERHGLGLHMATVALALGGWQPRFLGVDTPADELVAAFDANPAPDMLALSFAASYPTDRASRILRDLSDELPDDAELVYGGSGAPDRLGVGRRFDDLEAFYSWARELRSE